MIKNRLFASIAIAVFVLITMVPLLAQDTTSDEPEDPNWCNAGEIWEGLCSSENSDIEYYMWVAGWCGAMLEAGRIEFDDVEDCLAFFFEDEEEEDTVDVEEPDDDDDGEDGDADE